jgi:hypothetical protein
VTGPARRRPPPGSPGPRDRVNLGCNPKLAVRPDLPAIPYYGYGAGVVRLSLGDNTESGGPYRSSHHQWLFLTDAAVTADARPIVEAGRLVLP